MNAAAQEIMEMDFLAFTLLPRSVNTRANVWLMLTLATIEGFQLAKYPGTNLTGPPWKWLMIHSVVFLLWALSKTDLRGAAEAF